MVPSQGEHAESLGVRTRADNQHVSNDISTPSQGEHADAIGVSRNFPNLLETKPIVHIIFYILTR